MLAICSWFGFWQCPACPAAELHCEHRSKRPQLLGCGHDPQDTPQEVFVAAQSPSKHLLHVPPQSPSVSHMA